MIDDTRKLERTDKYDWYFDGGEKAGEIIGTVTIDLSKDGWRVLRCLSKEFILEYDQSHDDGNENYIIREKE